MSNKKSSGAKRRMQKSLQVMNARKAASNHKVVSTEEDIQGRKPVTRKDLYEFQKVMGIKIDTALMSAAALAEVMVKKELLTWGEFKEGEKNMLETLTFVRKTMAESVELMGEDAENEDIGSFIYEKAITFGVDKGVLRGIFGIGPTKSRIIKPKHVKVIQSVGRNTKV